ncbi:MAG: ATP-binding protein [Betaproteobacteria bacterium]|nr:ATP-binding protein [Betaproteobacteria bacterium]
MTEFEQLALDVGAVFTPGSPIDVKAMFAGRTKQLRQLIDAISYKGHHAVLYGERGVGKTSLANVFSEFLGSTSKAVLAPRVQKVFANIQISRKRQGLGFFGEDEGEAVSALEEMPREITPNDVFKMLAMLSGTSLLIVILDEFDRLPPATSTLLADTIKMLSDHSIAATVVLVGVADSVQELIKEHESVERALIQIPVPRMSVDELEQIVKKGLPRLNMTIDPAALMQITSLSQGLPYYTHLLALYAARAALDGQSRQITSVHIETAIRDAMERSQQSIKTSYYEATKSQQSDNIFRQVLLACALARTDEFGFFTAAAVKEPLTQIMKKAYDIPSFARHLKIFSEGRPLPILQRVGEKRKFRFRFSNPLMQPFVIMNGLAEGLISQFEVRDSSSSTPAPKLPS